MQKLTVVLLACSAIFAAIGQLLLKKGADGRAEWVEFLNTPISLGLIFYALGVIIWIFALSREALVNVYAFTALTFVLVYLGGVIIFNEQISRVAFVGILLILLGLYLVVKFNPQG